MLCTKKHERRNNLFHQIDLVPEVMIINMVKDKLKMMEPLEVNKGDKTKTRISSKEVNELHMQL